MSAIDLSPQAPRSCPQGHPLSDPSARFCRECGAPVDSPAAPLPACAAHPGVTARTACARCGTFACDACLRAQPAGPPLCFRCADREQQLLPWDRPEIGRARAFWDTAMLIVQKPKTTFETAAPRAALGKSLGFAVLANMVGLATTIGLYAVIFGLGGALAFATAEKEPENVATIVGAVLGALVAMTVVGLIFMVGYVFVSAALDHLVLRVIRARPGPFEVTMRAHALSYAPALIGLIPLCGLYVWPIWSVVLRVFAYRGLHRITTGQAVLGALVFPVLGVVLTLALYVGMIAFSMTRAMP